MAESAEEFCGYPGSDPLYHKLPDAAEEILRRPRVHDGGRSISGMVPLSMMKRLYPGDRRRWNSADIRKTASLRESTSGTRVMTGFGHGTILSMADQVIDASKISAIRHFFLVAGCDGAKPGRNYYTVL